MNKRSFLSAFSLGSGTLCSLPAIAGGSDQSNWQADGLGYRARIGLLTPNDDAVPESELWTLAPPGVPVHVARVLLVNTRTFADPPHPDDAVALLAALPMQAIVFAFTTTSYVLGPNGEQTLKARLEKRSNGIPVLLTGSAAVAAFRALGVQRIALIHPPWFADDEQQLGIAYFRNQGFDVVYASQMHLRGLPIAQPTDPLRKFTELYPAELYAFARSQVPATAEAVFFGGNGFRAIGVIAALEEDLGVPVLTGNQVAFWYALRQAGVRASTNGYGRVFQDAECRSEMKLRLVSSQQAVRTGSMRTSRVSSESKRFKENKPWQRRR
jgi:maleate isomerase